MFATVVTRQLLTTRGFLTPSFSNTGLILRTSLGKVPFRYLCRINQLKANLRGDRSILRGRTLRVFLAAAAARGEVYTACNLGDRPFIAIASSAFGHPACIWRCILVQDHRERI